MHWFLFAGATLIVAVAISWVISSAQNDKRKAETEEAIGNLLDSLEEVKKAVEANEEAVTTMAEKIETCEADIKEAGITAETAKDDASRALNGSQNAVKMIQEEEKTFKSWIDDVRKTIKEIVQVIEKSKADIQEISKEREEGTQLVTEAKDLLQEALGAVERTDKEVVDLRQEVAEAINGVNEALINSQEIMTRVVEMREQLDQMLAKVTPTPKVPEAETKPKEAGTEEKGVTDEELAKMTWAEAAKALGGVSPVIAGQLRDAARARLAAKAEAGKSEAKTEPEAKAEESGGFTGFTDEQLVGMSLHEATIALSVSATVAEQLQNEARARLTTKAAEDGKVHEIEPTEESGAKAIDGFTVASETISSKIARFGDFLSSEELDAVLKILAAKKETKPEA